MKKLVAGVGLWLMSNVPVGAEAEVLRDIVYGHKDGMALVMDVYQPDADANGAGVAYMVSSGYFSGREMQESYHGFRIMRFLDAGYTVFAVRHGSSPRYKIPDMYRDVTEAMEFIGVHAQDYGVDPDRVGVYGASAGGYFSLLVGLTETTLDGEPRRFRPAAVVAFRAPSERRPLTPESIERWPALDYKRLPGLDATLSPVNHASSDDPPVLLVHGDVDEVVPVTDSERMHAALKDAGVETRLVVLRGVPHEQFRGEGFEDVDTALMEWFQKYLR